MSLRLTNTLGGQKAAFTPLVPGKVRMYHCGPTVKEPLDLAKFRSFLLADVLRRHLERSGMSVEQVMNITDVGHLNEFEEDVIEVAAGRSGLQSWELSEQEEQHFHEERRALHILDAHHYPRAREHIDQMIETIRGLEKKGVCYRAGGNLYLDITSHPSLGELTGKSIEELTRLQESARTPAHPEKRHPLDIDLWRTDVLHQSDWDSPWGNGFPGWHVECAAMSHHYLGATFDIHTGTRENIFPHHECEIAQWEALTGRPMANVWLHSGPVTLDGKPMTRENRVSVRELLKAGIRAAVIRVTLLAEPYRETLDFGEAALARGRRAVNTILGFREYLALAGRDGEASAEPPAPWIAETTAGFESALDDDLAYGGAIDAVAETLERLEPSEVGSPANALAALEDWDRVLGVL